MRIRVDEIPESGRFVHFHWDESRLKQFLPSDDPSDLKLSRPVNVDLEIQKHPDHIRILGIIRGVLQLSCHRCLEPFEYPLEENVDVFLMAEERAPDAEETELDVEEMDVEFFDGEVIDIDNLVAEQIFLALPFKVLCSEDCLGLCQRCGANLNEGPCGCEMNQRDTPFARLKSIRRQLPE
ncbi:MAG: DUF177 domain-containing protein [Deltaproteobacteria bacterium]|jgi:uncharacterized protein|nr:DUF177 domain-containing protein [Deltaproteobacteria bacterium]